MRAEPCSTESLCCGDSDTCMLQFLRHPIYSSPTGALAAQTNLSPHVISALTETTLGCTLFENISPPGLVQW